MVLQDSAGLDPTLVCFVGDPQFVPSAVDWCRSGTLWPKACGKWDTTARPCAWRVIPRDPTLPTCECNPCRTRVRSRVLPWDRGRFELSCRVCWIWVWGLPSKSHRLEALSLEHIVGFLGVEFFHWRVCWQLVGASNSQRTFQQPCDQD